MDSEMEIDTIDDLFTWTVDRADDGRVTRWTTTINGISSVDPDADPVQLGSAECYVIPEDLVRRLVDELDPLSSDLSYVAEKLTAGDIQGLIDADDELLMSQASIAVLRTIEVEPRARKLGAPALVLRDFAIVNPTVGLIALHPCPIDAVEMSDEDVEAASRKLSKMWGGLGFELLPRADDVLVARADRFRSSLTGPLGGESE